jgi:hypothetical protein
MTPPAWLRVLKRGYVTLYFARVDGTRFLNGTQASEDRYWLCMRPGEEAAHIIAWWAGSQSNYTFRKNGSKYFSDCPELLQKIKDKTYKGKDILQVVNEYNDWKKGQKA